MVLVIHNDLTACNTFGEVGVNFRQKTSSSGTLLPRRIQTDIH